MWGARGFCNSSCVPRNGCPQFWKYESGTCTGSLTSLENSEALKDMVIFVLNCSYTPESTLEKAGLPCRSPVGGNLAGAYKVGRQHPSPTEEAWEKGFIWAFPWQNFSLRDVMAQSCCYCLCLTGQATDLSDLFLYASSCSLLLWHLCACPVWPGQ